MKVLADRLNADNFDVHGLSFNSENLKLPGRKTANIVFAKRFAETTDATTTTSGMSHRSIAPSPLSSVRFATSGDTMLLVSPFGPFHIHWITGSKLFGAAAFVQFGTPLVSS